MKEEKLRKIVSHNEYKMVLEILKKTMASNLLVVEKKGLPFCETEQMMTLEEIVAGMFDGKSKSHTCKIEKMNIVKGLW